MATESNGAGKFEKLLLSFEVYAFVVEGFFRCGHLHFKVFLAADIYILGIFVGWDYKIVQEKLR